MTPDDHIRRLKNISTLCGAFIDELQPLAGTPSIRTRLYEKWIGAMAAIQVEVEIEIAIGDKVPGK